MSDSVSKFEEMQSEREDLRGEAIRMIFDAGFEADNEDEPEVAKINEALAIAETDHLMKGENGKRILRSIAQLEDEPEVAEEVWPDVIGIRRRAMEKAEESCKELDGVYESEDEPEFDHIDHPEHYCKHPSGVECKDIIKYYSMFTGSAMKYLWRCLEKHPDPRIDLGKAIKCIQIEIDKINEEMNNDCT